MRHAFLRLVSKRSGQKCVLAWYVSEEGFRTLTVVMAPMPDSPVWRSNCQASTVKVSTTSVPIL